jgi:mRNA interferase RelE/StbE
MAPRVRTALAEYAATGAHANNVTQLVGSRFHRLRIGDYRVIFDEQPTEILVMKVGLRGTVYE